MTLQSTRATGACRPQARPLLPGTRYYGSRSRCSSLATRRPRAPGAAAVEVPTAPPIDEATPQAATPAAQDAQQPEGGKFDWQRQWYPLAAVECLKADKPQAVQLLGMRLVVYQDKGSGEWVVLEDVCPHRLAPLSDGRITETGELMCSYHGWTFDSQGSCTSIPQIVDPKARATACGSGRACVKRYPSQVLHDLLWVFGDASPHGVAEARAAPPAAALVEMGVGTTHELKQSWFQRDTPVGLDLLLENFLDPAHVPFSHHGVIGSREQDMRMEMSVDEERGGVTRDKGFSINVTNAFQTYSIDYQPPCRVRHNIAHDMSLILYGVPTSPGWSRVFVSFAGTKGNGKRLPNAPGMPVVIRAITNALSQVTPLFHALTQNNIIDGDHAFVQQAERTFWERGSHDSWARQYYMPSTSDSGVMAWRRWLDRFGAALPTLPKCAADLPPVDRMTVFDRYNQHTKHCPHCSSALRNINIALAALAAAAAAAAGAAVAALVSGGLPALARIGGGCAAAVVAAALLAQPLLKLRPLFLGGQEYVHAER